MVGKQLYGFGRNFINNMLIRLFLLAFLVGFVSNDQSITNSNVILITLDGTRWQDLFQGEDPFGNKVDSEHLFPNIYNHFVKNGTVFGRDSEVKVTGPAHISMPGYLEIMRGYGSLDCLNNECQPNLKPTLVNNFPHNAAVFASWDLINHITDNSPVVNTGRQYRNEYWKRLNISDEQQFPEYWEPEYRPDFLTGKAALKYYDIYHPQFLWISFGDTDEYAHAGDYPNYIKSLQWADYFIGEIMNRKDSNTTVIISPDHGRGNDWRNHGWDPASARTYLMLSGNKVPARGFVKAKYELHQSNIFPTVLHLTKNINSPNSLLNQ